MTRPRLLLLACAWLCACDDPAPPTPARVEADPPAPAPEAPAEPPPPPEPVRVEDVIEAYAAFKRRFAAGEREALDGTYAARMRCWGRRPNVDGAEVRQSLVARVGTNQRVTRELDRFRIRSIALTVERADDDEVILHDWAWIGRGGTAPGTTFEGRRLIYQRVGEGLRMVSEAPLGPGCGDGPAEVEEPPAVWTALRDAYQAIQAQCPEGTGPRCACEDHVPSPEAFCRSQLGCDPAPAACDPAELGGCVEGTAVFELGYFCAPTPN